METPELSSLLCSSCGKPSMHAIGTINKVNLMLFCGDCGRLSQLELASELVTILPKERSKPTPLAG